MNCFNVLACQFLFSLQSAHNKAVSKKNDEWLPLCAVFSFYFSAEMRSERMRKREGERIQIEIVLLKEVISIHQYWNKQNEKSIVISFCQLHFPLKLGIIRLPEPLHSLVRQKAKKNSYSLEKWDGNVGILCLWQAALKLIFIQTFTIFHRIETIKKNHLKHCIRWQSGNEKNEIQMSPMFASSSAVLSFNWIELKWFASVCHKMGHKWIKEGTVDGKLWIIVSRRKWHRQQSYKCAF